MRNTTNALGMGPAAQDLAYFIASSGDVPECLADGADTELIG